MKWYDARYREAMNALKLQWQAENGYYWGLNWSNILRPFVHMLNGEGPPRVTTTYEASCTVADFAEKWLVEENTTVDYDVIDAVYWVSAERTGPKGGSGLFPYSLRTDGVFLSVWGDMEGTLWEFKDRHEALAEAMVAVLKEKAAH